MTAVARRGESGKVNSHQLARNLPPITGIPAATHQQSFDAR
ncbi:hypothetical protein [Brasilonema bromeliae]|nr:hypothetical protein [Brasilonema bromeliae]